MPALILFFPWPSFFVTLFWYSKDVGRTEGVRGAFGGVLGRVQSKMSLSNALKRKRAMFLETVSRFRNIENQSRSVCHLKWNILSGWWGRRLVLSLWCQTEQPTCWVMFLILQTPTLCMTFRVRTWWTSVWISSEKKNAEKHSSYHVNTVLVGLLRTQIKSIVFQKKTQKQSNVSDKKNWNDFQTTNINKRRHPKDRFSRMENAKVSQFIPSMPPVFSFKDRYL